MRPVYVLGAGAHPWGKFPNKPQLQLALEAMGAALGDAGLRWRDLQGLVAASSRFEGGMGWGLHANEMLQAACENGITGVNVGGGCAAGGIAIHTAYTMVASRQCDLVAAVGAERMPNGFIPRPPGSRKISPTPITCAGWQRAQPTRHTGHWKHAAASMTLAPHRRHWRKLQCSCIVTRSATRWRVTARNAVWTMYLRQPW